MQDHTGHPYSGLVAAGDDYGLDGQLLFFRRNRGQALAGLAMSEPVMIALIWPRVGNQRLLLAWAAVHLMTVVATMAAFYLPFRRNDLTRFPRSAVASVSVSLATGSSTIFVVSSDTDDLAVVLGIAAVLFSVAAGTAITVGPLAPMARPALLAGIGPFAIGALVYGQWALGIASLYFLMVVALRGITATLEWFDELTELRAELAARAREAERAATTDSLTDLLNRQGLRQVTLECPPEATVHGIFVDLDGFKGVNDRYGHAAGDEVLAVVAERLRLQFRSNDYVARLGGDEFFIVVSNATNQQLADMAERVVIVVREPIAVEGGLATVSASVGIARQLCQGFDLDELQQRADRALYEAKRSGRDQIVYAPTPS